MADREQSLPVIAPDVGYVTGAARHAIPDRAWAVVANARFRKGRAEKVPGYVEVQAAALDSQVMGIYDFRMTTGFQAWIAVTRTKVYKKESTDASFVDITGATPLTAGFDDWADFTTFKDVLIITNGVDNVKKWTGSGDIADLGGSPPKAKRCATFQNHVVLAWIDPHEVTPFPQKIQWSDLGLMETWVGGEAGSLSFVDEATGVLEIMPLRDSLIAYKEDAIYLVDYTGFPFTMQTRRLATGIGPISARIVVDARDTHYFVSSDNQVYKLTLSGPEIVGQAVQFGMFDEMNFQYAHRAFGFLNGPDAEVHFVIPTGGEELPNMDYILNHLDVKWGRRDLEATAAAPKGARQLTTLTWDDVTSSWDSQTGTWNSAQYAAGANIILHGDTDGLVHKHIGGEVDANGVAIDCDIESKMFDFGDAGKKKRLLRLHVHYALAAGTTLSIYILTAPGPEVTPTVNGPYTLVLDGSGDQWVDINLTATYFGFRFRNNSLGQSFSLTGYVPVFYGRETT